MFASPGDWTWRRARKFKSLVSAPVSVGWTASHVWPEVEIEQRAAQNCKSTLILMEKFSTAVRVENVAKSVDCFRVRRLLSCSNDVEQPREYCGDYY